MCEQLKKLLTTLTTPAKVLKIKAKSVVSRLGANLPQYLPQLTTLTVWKAPTTLNKQYNSKLQACGKW